jgi:hypothetical protein
LAKKTVQGKKIGSDNARSGTRTPGSQTRANRRKELAKLNAEKKSGKAPGGSTSAGTGSGNQEVKGARGTGKVLKNQKGGAGTSRIRNVEETTHAEAMMENYDPKTGKLKK